MDIPEVEQITKINEILQKYAEGFGIHISVTSSDISPYFNYTSDQLKNLDEEECLIVAGLCLQKAAQIQVEINKHTRTKNWAEESMKHIIAPYIGQYDQFTAYELKKTLAVQKNGYAQKLSQLIRATQVYIDTLQFIPSLLKNQSDFFTNLARAKKKYES